MRDDRCCAGKGGKSFFRKTGGRLIGLSLAFGCLSLGTAKAQVSFGLKGGFQLTNMEFNSEVLEKSNRAGFFVGPTLKIGMPLTGMTINTSVLYDQHDLKVEGRTFTQKSIVAQGDARLGAGLGDVAAIFILAGPQLSFNVGDDVKGWLTKEGGLSQFALQETLVSFNIGAGVTFAKHFEGTIHYNIPISKTGDFTWQRLSNELGEQTWNHAKTRSNTWSVDISYYF